MLSPLCRGPVLLRCLRRRPAPQPGTLRWGDFLGGQKVTKDPPKAGPSPALWNPPCGTECTCVLLVSALGLEGSHRWHRDTIDSTYFSAGWCFYSPGPYPGKPLFPAIGGMAPSGGNAACPGRPGGGNRLAIGPVARIAWCGGSNRGHGVTGRPENHRRGSLVPQGRSLGGNALSDSFPHFSSGRNGAQRSVPGWGAVLLRRYRRRTGPLFRNKRT